MAVSDALELIFVHLGSVRNFQALIGRMQGAGSASGSKPANQGVGGGAA